MTGTLAFTTRKTQRRQILPLAKPLRQRLNQQPESVARRGHPVLPTLSSQLEEAARVGSLLKQFFDLMASSGLVAATAVARQSRPRNSTVYRVAQKP